MADSNIIQSETSQQNGLPIECYRFSYGDYQYLYTSSAENISLTFADATGVKRTELYNADYISRNNLKPSTKSDSSSIDVTVDKDNSVAKLFQGAPPETSVFLTIFRFHANDSSKRDVYFYGRIGQAHFEDSTCVLTVKMEDWADREIPRGKKSYYCQNILYNHNCQLVEKDWQVHFFLDKSNKYVLTCAEFANYPDDYFTNGKVRFNGFVRTIASHKGDTIKLRYPFVTDPHDDIIVSPGCDLTMLTCHKRFNNHLNFTGCPYVPPANPEKTGTGVGMYWVDSQVIQRDTDGYVGTISM